MVGLISQREGGGISNQYKKKKRHGVLHVHTYGVNALGTVKVGWTAGRHLESADAALLRLMPPAVEPGRLCRGGSIRTENVKPSLVVFPRHGPPVVVGWF